MLLAEQHLLQVPGKVQEGSPSRVSLSLVGSVFPRSYPPTAPRVLEGCTPHPNPRARKQKDTLGLAQTPGDLLGQKNTGTPCLEATAVRAAWAHKPGPGFGEACSPPKVST